ncbi:MAG: hypothetical protein R3E48_22725 [Burkholderiaceae bacterium]
MLCLLLLLRMPRTQVIYLTSTPIHESIVDYHLHLLPGVPGRRTKGQLAARLRRCGAGGAHAEDPGAARLLERLRATILTRRAHMTCFTVSNSKARPGARAGIRSMAAIPPCCIGDRRADHGVCFAKPASTCPMARKTSPKPLR